MKKVIRLTEQDLARIVRRVIMEQESSDLIGKSVNIYSGPTETQKEFWFQDKIGDVRLAPGKQVEITFEDEKSLSMWYNCTDTRPGFIYTGPNDQRMYNKQLESIIKKTYCTTIRDYDNNEKTVPNADFASTNRSSGNSSVA